MTQRLFLGFDIDAASLHGLVQLQQQLTTGLPSAAQAHRVRQVNLHLTLAFLGQVNSQQLPLLLKAIDATAKLTFSVTLNTLAHWAGPKVLCLAGKAQDTGLQQLACHAQEIAMKLNLHVAEHDFTPHVTLMRKVAQFDVATAQTTLPAHLLSLTLAPPLLHLYESSSGPMGVEYHILQSWELE